VHAKPRSKRISCKSQAKAVESHSVLPSMAELDRQINASGLLVDGPASTCLSADLGPWACVPLPYSGLTLNPPGLACCALLDCVPHVCGGGVSAAPAAVCCLGLCPRCPGVGGCLLVIMEISLPLRKTSNTNTPLPLPTTAACPQRLTPRHRDTTTQIGVEGLSSSCRDSAEEVMNLL